MIQRIQTIYFLLALIGVSLSLFNLNLFSLSAEAFQVDISVFQIVKSDMDVAEPNSLWIYSAVAAIAVLTTLLSFKDRDKQLLLSKLTLTITILTASWFTFSAFKSVTSDSVNELHLSFGFAFYSYVAAIPFLVLGLLGVRKDKKLIDSLNRLR